VKTLYLTVKQQVNHLSKEDFNTIKALSHIAKNLYNQGLYNVRQYYFQNEQYLNYRKNYALLKTSEQYKMLNSNMAQQILKEVDGTFKSFFGLIELAKQGTYRFADISLPRYLKKDGFTTLFIGFVRTKGNRLPLPYSQVFKKNHTPITISMPPILEGKKVKEIRIIPKAKFFEIQYTYQVEKEDRTLNPNNAIAIDLGINNLATCATSNGETFIVDGRRLQSIKDKQGMKKCTTKQQDMLYSRRNNHVNDYIAKTARHIIDYCLSKDIGTLVIGYTDSFQRFPKLGKRNNQHFVNVPFGNLKEKLEYLCELYGIKFVKQEESYTSRSSFFDDDFLPTYDADNPIEFVFSGKRIKRGLFGHARVTVNADVNGALNILKKSNVVSVVGLCARGEVDTPVRIRIA
jgi:IS605 OrfB family transposase